MAISQDFAQKLSEGSGGNYFSLANDKDFAVVRLMYETIEQIGEDIYAVHTTDDGKFECKRKNFTDPISVCPLCQSGNKPKAVVYLRLYLVDTKEAKVWEKSYQWYKQTLLPALEEVLNENPNAKICNIPIKIVRNGAKGDMKTIYNLFNKTPDNVGLAELGEPASIPLKEYDANAPIDDGTASNSSNNANSDNDNDLFRGM